MNSLPELGSKRNRNCVSPVQGETDNNSMCESTKSNSSSNNNNGSNGKEPPSTVWQQWTANFRASRRMKNDLLVEETIDASVERHMTLIPNKKRSLFDDESDSDDEAYYKLRRHPLEFTPSGFLPRLGPQQVTPASCDPDALPTCSLRRYGYDDDGFGCYGGMDDRIPEPPSFHRYPSKKRAVGIARPEPEQDYYNNRNGGAVAAASLSLSSSSRSSSGMPTNPFQTRIGALTEQKEEPGFPLPSTVALFGSGGFEDQKEEEKSPERQQVLFPPPARSTLRQFLAGPGGLGQEGATPLVPPPPPPPTLASTPKLNGDATAMPPPPPPALFAGRKLELSSQRNTNSADGLDGPE